MFFINNLLNNLLNYLLNNLLNNLLNKNILFQIICLERRIKKNLGN